MGQREGEVDILHVAMPDATVPRRLRDALQLLVNAAAKDMELGFEPRVRFFQTLYIDESDFDDEPRDAIKALVRCDCHINGPGGEMTAWRTSERRGSEIAGTAVYSDPETVWVNSAYDGHCMPFVVFHELEHLRQFGEDFDAAFAAAAEEYVKDFDVEQEIVDMGLDVNDPADAEEIAEIRASDPIDMAGDIIWEDTMRSFFSPEMSDVHDEMGDAYARTCAPDVATGTLAEVWAVIQAGRCPFCRHGRVFNQAQLLYMALNGGQAEFMVRERARRNSRARARRAAKQAAKMAA